MCRSFLSASSQDASACRLVKVPECSSRSRFEGRAGLTYTERRPRRSSQYENSITAVACHKIDFTSSCDRCIAVSFEVLRQCTAYTCNRSRIHKMFYFFMLPFGLRICLLCHVYVLSGIKKLIRFLEQTLL